MHILKCLGFIRLLSELQVIAFNLENKTIHAPTFLKRLLYACAEADTAWVVHDETNIFELIELIDGRWLP